MTLTPAWSKWWFTVETRVKCPDCGEDSPFLHSAGQAQRWIEEHIGNCRERPGPMGTVSP